MNMKKSLVSALTTALVMGAASTTFAAANPFEDVPADHWAYDAIAQLAADGVIEGYGDGTYRGDQEITRYEMAQMIARAMAKGGGDKALIDKLAAEFADELNNLGVRVAALEKKVDNVKWYGLFRYTYTRAREEVDANRFNKLTGAQDQNSPNHQNVNNFRLRLSMTAKINEHWTGNARMEYATAGNNNMDTAANDNTVVVNRVWAQGQYGKTTIMLGKFPYYTNVDDGMIFDDDLAGGFVQFGDKANIKLLVSRYNESDTRGGFTVDKDLVQGAGVTDINPVTTVSYQAIELNSDPTQKFTYGLGYHHYASGNFKNRALFNNYNNTTGKAYNDEELNIWSIGLGYRFDKNTRLSGAYATNTSGDVERKFRQAWSVQFNYKGVNAKDVGSWGAFVAYRHLGNYASVVPTYNSMFSGQKGVQVGVQYALFQNIVGMLEYYNGKNLVTDKRQDTIFGRVELYF